MKKYGIEYTEPTVILMKDTGIGVAESAARTCYDSFDKSENGEIGALNFYLNEETQQPPHVIQGAINKVNEIEHSDLLDNLAWTYFHHSILEHANISYLIRGTSRGVLQEHARHRIQAISVRSTRYTMSDVINIFVAEKVRNVSNTRPSEWFINEMLKLDLFVTSNKKYNILQLNEIYSKLTYQYNEEGKEAFLEIAVTKNSKEFIKNITNSENTLEILQSNKQKRNVGDAFKHIVNDNWKVDMVVTFNLRSLKNYFTLRDSGAAYFQIRWLAQEMIKVTPKKYLDLIIKGNKDD